MKIKLLVVSVLLSLISLSACASEDYNTQKGAAIGAIGGALAGQAIGRNTAGTLIGAAGGALVGAVAGNAIDQTNQEKRTQAQAAQMQAQAQVPPPQPAYTPPPPPPQSAPQSGAGQWVDVPGQWVNGTWVPAHKTWVSENQSQGEVAGGPPPPAYVPPTPPDMAPIAGTYVYFVPGINVDIFFYHGYWYRPWGGYWYWAPAYGGPWAFLPSRRVPRVLITLPSGWRRLPPGYHPVPYAEFHNNWQRWERERYWDHR